MQDPDDLRQELDRDALALSKVPADPILKTDPFGAILNPFERLTIRINESARLKIGATYTFVSQYSLPLRRMACGTISPADERISRQPGTSMTMRVMLGPSAFW